MSYFEHLLSLLHTERLADRQQYRLITESTGAAERRAEGLSWYPIAIRGSEFARGDYLVIEVERTTHQEVPHQLRSGVPAALFSNHRPAEDRVEGTVTYLNGNRLKLTLRTDELPDWSRQGKLGIDLLFDENSYQEMENAVKTAASSPKSPQLVNVLTGRESPEFGPLPDYPAPQRLNDSQQAAVRKILSANHLAIVHGPPGTGKTTTLVQAIKLLAQRDAQKILVVAPSNTAVDLLTAKLADEGLRVVRVGHPSRVSEQLQSLTLDGKMDRHPAMKDARELKKRAAEFRNMAHKYKRHFGRAERDQRKALFDEAHLLQKEAGKIEQFVTDDVLTRADVITATLVGANHYTVKHLEYTTVVIDEAGQALEPACWIAIGKAEKVVLAGDHQQLPPTIKSDDAVRKGLGTTLLEKCVGYHPDAVILLEEQYRMNRRIMDYSSMVFYGGRLMAHPSVADACLDGDDSPFLFIDTAGCGFDELSEGTSVTNPEEAAFVVEHLARTLTSVGISERPPSVAVISPYKRQIPVLQEMVRQTPALAPFIPHISVNTIDSFQGQERDVVYISLTRSNREGIIGFLSDIRRINVAMTRARKKLVVIGDSATLSRSPFYAGWIGYAEKIGAYETVWEYK